MNILLMPSIPQTHIFNQIPLASQNILILCFHELFERRILNAMEGAEVKTAVDTLGQETHARQHQWGPELHRPEPE